MNLDRLSVRTTSVGKPLVAAHVTGRQAPVYFHTLDEGVLRRGLEARKIAVPTVLPPIIEIQKS
ncbi:hypothetical protein ACYPKM_01870 [Pseudomonas aeruginosa]